MATNGYSAYEPPPRREPDLIDWAQLWNWGGFVLRAPLRHKRLALAAFAITLALGAVAAVLVPDRYEVKAVVLARPNPLMGALSNPVSRESAEPTFAVRELVLRRENLAGIVTETQMTERTLALRPPALRARDSILQELTGKAPEPEQRFEGLVDTLERKLDVQAGTQGAVTIAFRWWDREIAFDVVDAAVRRFLELRHTSEIATVGDAIAILERHRSRVRDEIQASVEQLETKEKASARPATAPRPAARPHPAEDKELSSLQATLAARKRALANLESFRQQRSTELQAELVQQQSVYASDHPAIASTQRLIAALSHPSQQVLDLRDEIADLEKEIARRGGIAAAGDARRDDAQADIEQARAFLQGDDPALELDRRQLSYLLHQYGELLNRIDSAQIEMETAEASFKSRYNVITPPRLPNGPVQSLKVLLGVGALLGGLAMAMFASTCADLLAGRILERWQIEDQLQLPVLGEYRR